MKKYLALGFSAILFAGGANAQYGRGLRVDPEGWKHCKFMAPMTRDVYTNLPRAASVQKWTPVPSTQGNTGTCVAWASTYCAATICWAQKNGVTNRQTITKNAMLPAYTYLHIKQSGDTYCQNGSDGESAARFLQTTGALKYSSNSEKCCLNGNPSNASEASQNKITSYTTLFYDWPIKRNTANVIKVKKAIAEGRPVIFGMMLPNSFMEERNFDSQGLYKPTENLNSVSEDGGHEMCIVAYDDDKFGGAFLVQNSWGTDWAYKGYFWLTYSIFVNTVVDAHSLYVPIASAANNTVDLTTSKLDFSTTGANSGCGYGGNDGGNDGGGNNGYDDYYNNDYNYDDGGYDNNNYGYDDYGYDDYGYDNYDNYYDGNYSYDNNDDYYYDPYGGFDNNNNYNYYDNYNNYADDYSNYYDNDYNSYYNDGSDGCWNDYDYNNYNYDYGQNDYDYYNNNYNNYSDNDYNYDLYDNNQNWDQNYNDYNNYYNNNSDYDYGYDDYGGYSDYGNYDYYGDYDCSSYSRGITPKGDTVNVYRFQGNIRLQLNDKSYMSGSLNKETGVIEIPEKYKSGTRFRILIGNNQPAYVYVFGTDLTNKVYNIFPQSKMISPFLEYKNSCVAFPDEKHFIEMDNTDGTDYLYVLYSLVPINIDKLRQRMEAEQGDYETKIFKALGPKAFSIKDSKFMGDKVFRFSSSTPSKEILVAIVKFNHVK